MWEDLKLRRMKKDSNSLKNMVGQFSSNDALSFLGPKKTVQFQSFLLSIFIRKKPFSFELPERRVCLLGPSTSIRPSSLDTSKRAVYF